MELSLMTANLLFVKVGVSIPLERAKVRRTRLSKNVFERSELFLRPLEASTADARPKGLQRRVSRAAALRRLNISSLRIQ